MTRARRTPRIPRHRLLAALAFIADGRVPAARGHRRADADDLMAFARAALAPLASAGCDFCGDRGCPACGTDTSRAVHSEVLRVVQSHGPITGRSVRAKVSAAPRDVIQALDALQREGVIERTGTGRPMEWQTRRPEWPGGRA